MLTLTNETIDVITTTMDVWDLPESAGLRIAADPADPLRIEAQVVEEPDANDATVEVVGARVYLDPIAECVLDDKVLDVEARPGGNVALKVIDQAEYASLR